MFTDRLFCAGWYILEQDKFSLKAEKLPLKLTPYYHHWCKESTVLVRNIVGDKVQQVGWDITVKCPGCQTKEVRLYSKEYL